MRYALTFFCALLIGASCLAAPPWVTMQQVPPSSGGGPLTQWITTPNTGATLRNNGTYVVGEEIEATVTIPAKALSRLITSGDSQTHRVGVWSMSQSNAALATFTFMGSVSVNASGYSVGYGQVSLGSTITMTTGNFYIVAVEEFLGGDMWYNAAVPTQVTSVAVDCSSVFSVASFTTLESGGSAIFTADISNQSYAQPSFSY